MPRVLVAQLWQESHRPSKSGEEKKRKPERLEIVADHGAENIVIHIAANNDNVAKQLTFGNGSCQTFKKSIDGISIVVVIIEVFAVLSIDT